MKNSKSKEDLGDLIEKKCDNCVFWYNRYCTYHNSAAFSDGFCEYHKLRKILPSN